LWHIQKVIIIFKRRNRNRRSQHRWNFVVARRTLFSRWNFKSVKRSKMKPVAFRLKAEVWNTYKIGRRRFRNYTATLFTYIRSKEKDKLKLRHLRNQTCKRSKSYFSKSEFRLLMRYEVQ
jgi:hypothetical protein